MKKIITWGKRFLGLGLIGLLFILFYLNRKVEIQGFDYLFGVRDFDLMTLMSIAFVAGAITSFFVMVFVNASKFFDHMRLKSTIKQLTKELEQEKRKNSVL